MRTMLATMMIVLLAAALAYAEVVTYTFPVPGVV